MDGLLFAAGRTDEVIDQGGEALYPRDRGSAYRRAGCRDAVVIGRANPAPGQIPVGGGGRLSACCLQYRYITAAAAWRGRKFALAHLTDIPGRLRLIYVRANKSSARPVTEARRRLPASARCMAGYQGVGPITRGRARGPPTMLPLTTRYQPGLVRRFLERAYLGRSACVVSNQGSGAAGGHQYQRDLRVRLDASAAA